MRILAAGVLVVLGGCAIPGSSDPSSPYFAFGPGWQVQLHRTLTIPADAASVRLQQGSIVPRNSVQAHEPYCVVELETVRSEPQVLQPGRFEAWQVTRSSDSIAAAPAAISVTVGAQGHDTGPSFLYYKTEFRLRSDAQPAIRSLTCAWDQMTPGNRPFMRHLTLDEMRRALGGWISLNPPKETP